MFEGCIVCSAIDFLYGNILREHGLKASLSFSFDVRVLVCTHADTTTDEMDNSWWKHHFVDTEGHSELTLFQVSWPLYILVNNLLSETRTRFPEMSELCLFDLNFWLRFEN